LLQSLGWDIDGVTDAYTAGCYLLGLSER
jgi:hypothetical protein